MLYHALQQTIDAQCFTAWCEVNENCGTKCIFEYIQCICPVIESTKGSNYLANSKRVVTIGQGFLCICDGHCIYYVSSSLHT